MNKTLKLALGALPYYWPREETLSFYESIARAPVDIVYLGETVCSRRHELRLSDWLLIADQLVEAGKEVVLSTQVLIESEADLLAMRKICDNARFSVEANEIGALHCLSQAGVSFIAGAHLNIYNAKTLGFFAELGVRRWVMPYELGKADLQTILAENTHDVETEVLAYGRIPLAFSARCFTARHYDLQKEDCQFSCLSHPDGLVLATKEQQDLLILNGTQTQTYAVTNLMTEIPIIADLGVGVLRINPQSQHTLPIIDAFSAVISGEKSIEDASRALEMLNAPVMRNGYWYSKPGFE